MATGGTGRSGFGRIEWVPIQLVRWGEVDIGRLRIGPSMSPDWWIPWDKNGPTPGLFGSVGSTRTREGPGHGDGPRGQPASRPVKERDSSIQVSIRETFTRRDSAFRWAIDWATRIAIEAMR